MNISIAPFYNSLLGRPFLKLAFALLLLTTAVATAVVMRETSPPPKRTIEAVEVSSQTGIEQLRLRVQRNPENAAAYAQLGLGLLQRVRIAGDPTLYTQAEDAFNRALDRDPQQLDALVGHGILALALHDFPQALEWAQQAQALNPFRAQIVGIMVDAYVELGQYEMAVEAAQQMVDLRPDLHSYSRVSYIRELHGDVKGAVDAMQVAVEAGVPGTEQWLWSLVQLGHLYFHQGDLATAEEVYSAALDSDPAYAYALAGLARVEAARGNETAAIARYEFIVERLPLPEFVIALGELYEATNQPTLAQEQYDLVQVIQRLNAESGQNVELELAIFNAQHGDAALALKQARRAFEMRPTVYAADTLAWALYQNGAYEEAWSFAQRALDLGTQDATMHFHAGMIALALAKESEAQRLLEEALSINPSFSIWGADVARDALKRI